MLHWAILLYFAVIMLFLNLDLARIQAGRVNAFYEALASDRFAQLGVQPNVRYPWRGKALPELPPLVDFGSHYSKRRHAPALCFLAAQRSIELDSSLRCD